MSVSQLLDSVKIVDISGRAAENANYRVVDVELDVQTYRLHEGTTLKDVLNVKEAEHAKQDFEDEAGSLPQARLMALPHKDLDGLWESYAILS